jgi:hypothetical protein
MQLDDYHKITQDYIRAGVRGTDLVQRVMNSSAWQLARTQEFLIEHYPKEVEEVVFSILNKPKPNKLSTHNDAGSLPFRQCPKCGKPMGEEETSCWVDNCIFDQPG